jgi:hypothetical protein
MLCRTPESQAKGSTLLSFAVAMREQTVAHRTAPPSEPANRWFLRDGSNGALDRVVVELDTTVIEEAGEGGPAPERVADSLGEGAGGWNAAKLHLEPKLHQLDERQGADVTHMPARLCGAAPDRTLDRIEFGDPSQGLGGNR